MTEHCIDTHHSHSEEEDQIAFPSAVQINNLQQRKFPVTSNGKNKTVFDSADYFMQRDQERRQNPETDLVEVAVPNYPNSNAPAFKSRRAQKKTFDSADYYMEQHREQRRRDQNPPEVQQPAEAQAEACISRRRPLLKNHREQKKTFDSADYFMDQEKLHRTGAPNASSSITHLN